MWSTAVTILLVVLCVVHAKQRHNKFDFNSTVQYIYADPLQLKQSYLGPLIKLNADQKTMTYNCQNLYSNHSAVANSMVWPPPISIPAELRDQYTLDGKVSIKYEYRMEKQNNGDGYRWKAADVDALSKKRVTCGNYNSPVCEQAIKMYQHLVKGKNGVVVGSQTFWAEAALLKAEAAHVTTIEYMRIKTDHAKLTTLVPDEVTRQVLDGKLPQYDFAWSFSSLEHDGLGRYGDPINPTGDLESILKIRCLLKPGGFFFFSVPSGPDCLVWNAHRIYGKLRLSLIFPNWELVDLVGLSIGLDDKKHKCTHPQQPIWVLRKPLK